MDLLRKKFITNQRKAKELTEEKQLLFMTRLYRLLIDGYSLVQALRVIEWNESLIPTSRIVKDELMKGNYIDEAFQEAHFHHTIVAYLYFVRFNHDLTTSLDKAIHMFTTRVENRKKFSRIIRYPIFLTVIFIILLFFLKNNILPSFIDLFQYSQDSSSTILISITIIDLFITSSIVISLLILFGVIGWKFYLRKLPIEVQMKHYKMLPFYRSFIRMQTSYYFTAHISMFLQTGMSMKEILQQMVRQQKLPIIAYYAKRMQMQLQNGFQLGHLINSFYFIESQIAHIFDQHQNNDSLEQDLRAYADFVIENMERKVSRAMMIIQPVFFIILASFIVFIYLALMWPMFQIIQAV